MQSRNISTSPKKTRTSIPGEWIIAIDKRTALGILAVFIILLVAFFIFNYRNLPTERHTCYFDKGSLDIVCSEELRIEEGSHKWVNYFDPPPVYSEGPSTNLRTIAYNKLPGAISDEDLFTEPNVFDLRLINVQDVETGESFTFYVKETRGYDVEENNTIDYYVDCCSKNTNTVCLPDPEGEWRCVQYDRSARMCRYLTEQIEKGEQPVELCYESEKEDLVAYCLSETTLPLCYEYVADHPDYKRICELETCKDSTNDTYNCIQAYKAAGE